MGAGGANCGKFTWDNPRIEASSLNVVQRVPKCPAGAVGGGRLACPPYDFGRRVAESGAGRDPGHEKGRRGGQ